MFKKNMKTGALLLISLFFAVVTYGQDVTGNWNGTLVFSGARLRLVFKITKAEIGYASTMDSPDQGAAHIPMSLTTFKESLLTIEANNLNIEYSGTLQGDTIAGTFKQNGFTFPLNLSRGSAMERSLIKPQEPIQPYPYRSEDVTFFNKSDKFSLAGTLTMPKVGDNFPAVILISGSGPQNRDEEILGHKPFLVVSDYLSNRGIAVLRYDDRGTAKSEGNFASATSLDFASDLNAAITYLQTRKEIDRSRIGLIGHSEGGLIAAMIAAKTDVIRFMVLLATPGIPGDQLLLMQKESILKASGVNDEDIKRMLAIDMSAFSIIKKNENVDSLRKKLITYLKGVTQGSPDNQHIIDQVNQMTSPWIRYYLNFDPASVLEKVKCAVLALNGDKDLQVPATVNLAAIQNAILKGGNKQITIKQLLKLNHLFQECVTGAPTEYSIIEQTISPTALFEINEWILKQAR